MGPGAWKQEGLLVVISSPSGGGKTTIVNQLREKHPEYVYSVSVTTRPRRPGEVDGQDYSFVQPEEFQRRRERGEFAEWARVHDHEYGTPKRLVREVLASGQIALFDLDVQGGLQIKRVYSESVLVFLLPPTFEELEKRLRARQTDEEGVIRTRLKNARQEMTFWPRYDFVVMNDHLTEAVSRVEAIILAERCRSSRNQIDFMNEQNQ
jgi:guanylate kinase